MKPAFLVEPGAPLVGRLRVPGDKSVSHRAVIFGGLAAGETRVSGFLAGADCNASLAAMEQLGATVTRTGDGTLKIAGRAGRLLPPAEPLDLGNAGTGLRLLAGVLAGQDFTAILTGDRSLCSRPMSRIIEPLTLMGAEITSEAGRAPLTIKGRRSLQPVDYQLPVASAQVQSAVLLAGLAAEGKTRVRCAEPVRDHTLRMLSAMGAAIEADDDAVVVTGPSTLQGTDVEVPGDFSSAAFFLGLAAAVPGADLTVEQVGVNPTRTGFLTLLELMGADLELRNQRVSGGEPLADIRVRGRRLQGIEVPPSEVVRSIDEFPILFVVAALAHGRTRVTGASELRVKESDRLATMARALAGLGAAVQESEDGLVIEGRGQLGGGEVSSGGDHRVAMAMAMAGQAASKPVRVFDVGNVGTSYPGFVRDASAVGLKIKQIGGKGEADLVERNNEVPVIAVDGPSGSGKGTISRLLASALGWHLLDSGALYRLTALVTLDAGADPSDEAAVAALAAELDVRFTTDEQGNEQILLAGQDVTRRIRSERCGEAASKVAPLRKVRRALNGLQLGFRRPPGLVADGRDMGTVVFPDAALKIFLTASAEERAERRYKQLKEKDIGVSLAALREEIAARDERDQTREVAPLVPAEDALIIDTTGVGIEDVFQRLLDEAKQRFSFEPSTS